jgi:hypothetical protein
MAKVRAQFNRHPADQQAIRRVGDVPDVDSRTTRALEKLCPPAIDAAVSGSGLHSTRQRFAQAILSEALWARSMVEDARAALSPSERIAELEALDRLLQPIERLLPTVSRDVAVELGLDIRSLLDAVKPHAADISATLTRLRGFAEDSSVEAKHLSGPSVDRSIAVELAVRVLRVCRGYRIPIAATAGGYRRTPSTAVRVLMLAGEVARLHRSEATWRDDIRRARSQGSAPK